MMRPLGTATDYMQLHALLRKRKDELGISFQTLNEISGLSYCEKLLAPDPLNPKPAPNGRATPRCIGAVALGPLIQAMGLALIVVEDVEATARLRKRSAWVPRCENYVNPRRPTDQAA